jgi:hypothetical protein
MGTLKTQDALVSKFELFRYCGFSFSFGFSSGAFFGSVLAGADCGFCVCCADGRGSDGGAVC